MIKVYLDMDGVIADFPLAWAGHQTAYPNEKFRDYTLKYKIFEKLYLMPQTLELLDVLEKMEYQGDIEVVYLSSSHTYKVDQHLACLTQKQRWIQQHGLPSWPLILTHCGEEKAKFAESNSVLIDDRKTNCQIFEDEGGKAFVYDCNVGELEKFLDKLIPKPVCDPSCRGIGGGISDDYCATTGGECRVRKTK